MTVKLTAIQRVALELAAAYGVTEYNDEFAFYGRRYESNPIKITRGTLNQLHHKRLLAYVETINGAYRFYQVTSAGHDALQGHK